MPAFLRFALAEFAPLIAFWTLALTAAIAGSLAVILADAFWRLWRGRLFTLFWAGCFVLKAAVFLWLAATLPLKEAMALRSALGGLSLALMMALSLTQGRRLFSLCRRFGWLGREEAQA